jgi:hypothetical protein
MLAYATFDRDPQRAAAMMEDAVALDRGTGSDYVASYGLNQLFPHLFEAGMVRELLAGAADFLERQVRIGAPPGVQMTLGLVGLIALDLGDEERGRACLESIGAVPWFPPIDERKAELGVGQQRTLSVTEQADLGWRVARALQPLVE